MYVLLLRQKSYVNVMQIENKLVQEIREGQLKVATVAEAD